jgi:CheY-like chemotaxis protein
MSDSVVCAEDGVAALKVAQVQKPDLIWLDMILPRTSRPEVLERLKHDAATVHIPVVVLSSLTEKNREKLMQPTRRRHSDDHLKQR